MSYEEEELGFRAGDEDLDDPLEPLEENGDFVFEEEEEDPDSRYH